MNNKETDNSKTNLSPLPQREDRGGSSDFDSILMNGINFSRGGQKPKTDDKVKTKAKKKKYITGAHGSGSAMQKAKYRKQRANRKH